MNGVFCTGVVAYVELAMVQLQLEVLERRRPFGGRWRQNGMEEDRDNL